MGVLKNINPYGDILSKEQFSGCPGDSGSAVYYGKQKLIVGVNSFINPLTTEFVRFDDGMKEILSEKIKELEARPTP